MSLLPYKLHEHNFCKHTIEINSQTHHNTAYTIGNIPWAHHCTIKLIASFKWILYIIKENNQLEIRHHCMARELETRWVYELLIWLTNAIIKGWKGAKGLLFKRTFLYCFEYLNMMLSYHTHLYIYIYCFTHKKKHNALTQRMVIRLDICIHVYGYTWIHIIQCIYRN